MLIVAESSAAQLALLGLEFLGLTVFLVLIARVWFPYLLRHPPREGTLLYENWRLRMRVIPYLKLVLYFGAFACSIAGVCILIKAAIEGPLT